MEIDRAHLFFREGSSDKEYLLTLDQADGGYLVNFAFGRRGSALKPGSKTTSPVVLDEARKIFGKLLQEKTAKGYTPEETGIRFASTDFSGRVSGVACQLLNPLEEDELSRLLDDDNWAAQEKKDGERRLVRKDNAGVVGINRKGLIVGLPETLVDAVADAPDFLIDGEAIGTTVHVFDLLSVGGEDLRDRPWIERQTRLAELAATLGGEYVVLDYAVGRSGKAALVESVRAANGEGVVLKSIDAPYCAGRPASGGSQRKYKFQATASVLVVGQNTQRSVALAVIDESGARIAVGNVAIPQNQEMPEIGAILEVRYLYAYPNGSLYQPVCLGVRGDLDPADCGVAQLKYVASGG